MIKIKFTEEVRECPISPTTPRNGCKNCHRYEEEDCPGLHADKLIYECNINDVELVSKVMDIIKCQKSK